MALYQSGPSTAGAAGKRRLVPAGEPDPDLLGLVPADAHGLFWIRGPLPYGKTFAVSVAPFFDGIAGGALYASVVDGEPGEARLAAVKHVLSGKGTKVHMLFASRMSREERAQQFENLDQWNKPVERDGRTIFTNSVGLWHVPIGPRTKLFVWMGWFEANVDQMTGKTPRAQLWKSALKRMPSDANVVLMKRRTDALGNHVPNPKGMGLLLSFSIKPRATDFRAHIPTTGRRAAQSWKSLLSKKLADASRKLPVTAKAMKRISFLVAEDGLTMVGSWPRDVVERVDAELLEAYRKSPEGKRRAEKKRRKREREERRRQRKRRLGP
jgi:hypothetical protein